MLKIYGSMLCPDCVECCNVLEKARIPYVFLEFGDDLRNLKEFLSLRDTEEVFSEIKNNGKIGIPCIVSDDGRVMLDWEKYVSQDES